MLLTVPSPHKDMDSLHSRAMVKRDTAHMPNLLQLTAVTARQHLQLEGMLSSSNSMGPHMDSQHQLVILLLNLLLMATPSQPRVMVPVVMTVLLQLLLQLPLSLMALSLDILPSLLIQAMASRQLPLHHRVTAPTVNLLAITKIATLSHQHMVNNSLATRPNSRGMASSKVATNNRPSSSNRLLLPTHPRMQVLMGSRHPASMGSRVDHPVTTSPIITVVTDKMARVEGPVTRARNLQGTQVAVTAGVLAGMALTEEE